VATNLEKFRGLLEELFQLDRADLDFGIYRIMNTKRDEVVRFLDKDLLPQVQAAFRRYKSADRSVLQAELAKLETRIIEAGMNPADSPKINDLKKQIENSAVDVTALENEVFSHLFSFFRRYYNEGDFISQRRYKEGVYAIPYEGEEVKLHWANADQYYVKSSETFRDYTFTLAEGKRVRLHVVAASTEHDSNKPAPGKERRFILAERPVAQENGELVIRFEYRPFEGNTKQDELNKQAIQAVLSAHGFEDWKQDMAKLSPTDKNKERTVLEKHLSQYTSRNTSDYFVHRDLGGFLRRELDFYIKNEVMHLDDIEYQSIPQVEQYLSQIKVIRSIAHKIIQFLEQLESFQKKLWLKQKFVIETTYCVTLDQVPEELYPEIAANDEQRQEWVRLFAIDEIKRDLTQCGYSIPLKVEFLKQHTSLSIDSGFFDRPFVDRLIASLEDLDAKTNGILVHGDNFHALLLANRKMAGQIKCIYIDPPYNTDTTAIPYKNNYRHSSWGTMMRDRLVLLHNCLSSHGVIFVSIDKHERNILEYALDEVFGPDNHVEELIWTQNTNDGRSPTYSTNHEYVEVYAKHRPSVESDVRIFREPKPGFTEVAKLIRDLSEDYPTPKSIEARLHQLYKQHKKTLRKAVEAQNLNWEIEKRNDPWKGIYQYKFAEYRDASGRLVDPGDARTRKAAIWVFRESDWTIMSSDAKQSKTTRDSGHSNYRFYVPVHPLTQKPCAMPSRGWKGTQYVDPKHPKRKSWESLITDHRIAFGQTESKVPQQKRFLHEVSTNVSKSVFADYSDGEKETSALFGRAGVFLAPKHTNFVRRFIRQTIDRGDTVLDCFGGSGSTAHAVIKSNREDGTQAKYFTVETNYYFDTVIKPRVLKAVYAEKWSRGKPDLGGGLSQIVKVIRLETYEDALNNLDLRRTNVQSLFLDADPEMREEYILSYMLDVESRGSQSLLNVEAFRNPDEYKLRVERNGETQLVNVDLVETFNWLLGVTVKHIDMIRGVRVVEGTAPNGDRVLVLWRNIDKMDSDALDQWFEKQDYNTREMTYDVFYVNGDNNLENLRRPDQTWKVRLIEEEFHRLMFEAEGV
jgi:adenine-specific DNA-methyltransferase